MGVAKLFSLVKKQRVAILAVALLFLASISFAKAQFSQSAPQSIRQEVSPTPSILSPTSEMSASIAPTISQKTAVKATASPTPTMKQNPTSPSNSSAASDNQSPTNTPTPQATPAPTAIPTQVYSGASVSTTSVNITMNRGETKNSVFTFTSTGATGFFLLGYPTSIGSGILWNPSSGGFSTGQTIPVSITVNSSVTPGTYTGTGTLKFSPGDISKTVQFSITVQEPPAASMGFNFSTDSVNVTIPQGGKAPVFTFTSTGSTAFIFPGYPTSYGPGINWVHSSGGASNGRTITQEISLLNVPAGTYSGAGLFRDETTGAEKSIPVTVTVTN